MPTSSAYSSPSTSYSGYSPRASQSGHEKRKAVKFSQNSNAEEYVAPFRGSKQNADKGIVMQEWICPHRAGREQDYWGCDRRHHTRYDSMLKHFKSHGHESYVGKSLNEHVADLKEIFKLSNDRACERFSAELFNIMYPGRDIPHLRCRRSPNGDKKEIAPPEFMVVASKSLYDSIAGIVTNPDSCFPPLTPWPVVYDERSAASVSPSVQEVENYFSRASFLAVSSSHDPATSSQPSHLTGPNTLVPRLPSIPPNDDLGKLGEAASSVDTSQYLAVSDSLTLLTNASESLASRSAGMLEADTKISEVMNTIMAVPFPSTTELSEKVTSSAMPEVGQKRHPASHSPTNTNDQPMKKRLRTLHPKVRGPNIWGNVHHADGL